MRPLGGGRVRAVLGATLALGTSGGTILAWQGASGASPGNVTLFVRTGSVGATCSTATMGPAPGDACGSIQQAVTKAETFGSTTAVTITVGSNAPSRTYAGEITIAASGLASLTIQGAGTASTRVTGRFIRQDFHVTGGTVSIEDLAIDRGRASTGGGVFSRAGAILTLSGDTFARDSASHDGGAVMEYSYVGTATATLTDDTFWDDSAVHCGGGFENYGQVGAATALVTDDTFWEDSANCGGGVENYGYQGSATATVTDDTFWQDTATDGGGGINNWGTDEGTASATMTGDTFSEDTATLGGGGVNGEEVTGGAATERLSASILDASSCFNVGSTLSGTYDVWTTTTTTTGCGASLGGEATTTTEADVATTLKANGSTGPETLALHPTSPAIDEVPPSECASTPAFESDERGDPRPGISGQTSCDAGAYELQHTPSTLAQGRPKRGSVLHGTATAFQLAVANPLAKTGKVSFESTGSVPTGVTVLTTGEIAVAATTARGTYTLGGIDSDPVHDAGTWLFVLHVTR